MENTYPGMHPRLENKEYFHDFHTSLLVDIRYYLAPRLPERYRIQVEKSLTLDGLFEDRQVFTPSVQVSQTVDVPPTQVVAERGLQPEFVMDAPVSRPTRFLEIRDRADRLVTTIEILSPSNKRLPDFQKFQEKQSALHENGVHLVEIDLLRKGLRRWTDARANGDHYLFTTFRAEAESVEVWTARPDSKLPKIAVPLRAPDGDLSLDIQYLVREYLLKTGLDRELTR